MVVIDYGLTGKPPAVGPIDQPATGGAPAPALGQAAPSLSGYPSQAADLLNQQAAIAPLNQASSGQASPQGLTIPVILALGLGAYLILKKRKL